MLKIHKNKQTNHRDPTWNLKKLSTLYVFGPEMILNSRMMSLTNLPNSYAFKINM